VAAAVTDEELAALIVALNAVAPQETEPAERPMPAWRRAMRVEAVESGV